MPQQQSDAQDQSFQETLATFVVLAIVIASSVLALRVFSHSIPLAIAFLTPKPHYAPTVSVSLHDNSSTTISWTSVENADGYTVWFFRDDLMRWSRVEGDPESPFLHANLTSGVEYTYMVAGYSAGGQGPQSDWRLDGSKIILPNSPPPAASSPPSDPPLPKPQDD